MKTTVSVVAAVLVVVVMGVVVRATDADDETNLISRNNIPAGKTYCYVGSYM